MDIVKWTPFRDLDRFFDSGDFFPILPAISRKAMPKMNVYETKDSVVAEVSLAGVDPKDVKVTVEDDILTVKGEMKEEREEKEKDYYFKEIKSGSFMRSVSLPVRTEGDKAQAESKDGMLKITIPKAEEVKKTKEIPVKVVNKK